MDAQKIRTLLPWAELADLFPPAPKRWPLAGTPRSQGAQGSMLIEDGKTLAVQLPRGLVVIADVEDSDFILSREWRVAIGYNGDKKARAYAFTHNEDRSPCGKKTTTLMHRALMGVSDRWTLVDHKNFCGLDNRRNNIRLATPSNNCQNKKKRTDSRWPYKGVCQPYSSESKWIAQIWVNGKNKSLGRYDTAILAAEAYDRAAIEYYGEFACLNFSKEKGPAVIAGPEDESVLTTDRDQT